ncbi:MAG: insulinase family protein [Candidatus Sericytochromatia bacterium]|nr:insulinase family protein [Candidatus Sericytochromatia bacterium]
MTDFLAAWSQRRLANGLDVWLYRDTSLPLVTSMLWYRVGSGDEAPGITGYSHFLEHMLFKGSQRFGSGDLDRLTLACGGCNNAFTSLDATAYLFQLPAPHWRLALEIEADRMRGARLDADELNTERAVILEEWQTAADDPEELLWEQLNQLALLRHAYRYPVLGWPEDIQACSPETLRSHYDRYYHPNQALLLLVGDLPEDALEQVEGTLGQIPAGPPAPPRPHLKEEAPQGQRRLTLKREDVQVARLVLAWPAPAFADPDYLALNLFQYLFSEGWSSRLQQVLVEQKQLASSVSSVLFETREPYLFWVQLDARLKAAPDALEQAFFEVLQQLLDAGIQPAELERARRQCLTDFYLSQETTEGLAQWAGEVLTTGQPEDFYAYVSRLQAITPEQLQQALQRWLDPERLTLGWLLPDAAAETEEPQTEPPSEPARLTRSLRRHRPASAPPVSEALPWPESVPPRWPDLPASAHTLANGLRVWAHANTRRPIFCMELLLPAGVFYETPAQRGVASLTLALLMKGTHQRSAPDFAQALDQLGVSLDVFCGYRGVVLQMEGLSEAFAPALELLTEAVCEPLLAAAEFDKLRHLALVGLAQAEESPSYQVGRAFVQALYANTPLAESTEGREETLQTLTTEDVQAFYAQHYQPQSAALFLAGALPADWSDRVVQALGQWAPGTQQQPALASMTFQAGSGFCYRHLLLPERDQVTLVMGHLGVSRQHPDFLALLVLEVILGSGSGFAARIPHALREEQGLAYYVSWSASLGAHLHPGLVQAELECAPDKVHACVQGVLAEIRRVQQEGVTPRELEMARAALWGQRLFALETNAQRCDFLLQRDYYAWPDSDLKAWTAALEALDTGRLQQVARQHLHTRNYTLITAGPALPWSEKDFARL